MSHGKVQRHPWARAITPSHFNPTHPSPAKDPSSPCTLLGPGAILESIRPSKTVGVLYVAKEGGGLLN